MPSPDCGARGYVSHHTTVSGVRIASKAKPCPIGGQETTHSVVFKNDRPGVLYELEIVSHPRFNAVNFQGGECIYKKNVVRSQEKVVGICKLTITDSKAGADEIRISFSVYDVTQKKVRASGYKGKPEKPKNPLVYILPF